MKLGVIGYGSRIGDVIGELTKQDPDCRVTAFTDPHPEPKGIASSGQDKARMQRFETAEQMLEACELDGVLIGTRCDLHTEMALQVLPRRIPLYLEKPVATNGDDLLRLRAANERFRPPAVVSFPLRVTIVTQMVKEIVDSGKIGTIEHVQAVNNVPYGAVYYQNWYRDERVTGGLFLQKATHDFDYLNYVIGMQPVEVAAMTSKQIFKGDRPAGLKCKDCSDNRTCPDSTAFATGGEAGWEYCCYAEDTGNEDSGSVLLRYATGMHAVYSQNFFVRRGAGKRGARFMGYKGTLEFDFVTGEIHVFMHHTPRVETYRFESGEGHHGGDAALARSYAELVRGTGVSVATLEDGLNSALLCLKAKESAETRQFCPVSWA